MSISSFADDDRKGVVNGKVVAEASVPTKQVEFPLSSFAQSGTNTIEIAYEAFGSPNFGEKLGELKGIESVRLGNAAMDSWQIQRFPAAMRGREIDPAFSVGGWQAALLGGAAQGND